MLWLSVMSKVKDKVYDFVCATLRMSSNKLNRLKLQSKEVENTTLTSANIWILSYFCNQIGFNKFLVHTTQTLLQVTTLETKCNCQKSRKTNYSLCDLLKIPGSKRLYSH